MKQIQFLVLVMLFALTPLFAQKTNTVIMPVVTPFVFSEGTYYSNSTVTDFTAVSQEDQYPESTVIKVETPDGFIELNFPDESTIVLNGQTEIILSEITRQQGKKKKSKVKLNLGKLFAKITKSKTQDFRVETKTAVAAVRGTEFGVESDFQGVGNVIVQKGLVAVGDVLGKFDPVMVKPGNFTAFGVDAAPSAPAPAPADMLAGFRQPSPDNPNAAGAAKKPVQKTKQQSQDKAKTGSTPKPLRVNMPNNIIPGEIPPRTKDATAAPKPKETKSNECSDEGMNYSISSETLDGEVWNKVLISPTFKLGDLTLSLYLPMYFKDMTNVFMPNTWYNASEWNFGTGTNGQNIDIPDIFHDLLLKLRYVQYKNKMISFKLGSIPDMTLGHGSLINGYANDLQFPAQRKVGIELGMDFGVFGFQALVADMFPFEENTTKLAGARLFVRPFFGKGFVGNLGFGLSGFLDWEPRIDTNITAMQDATFGYALDVDFPMVDLPIFTMTLFADVATLGYIDSKTTNAVYYPDFSKPNIGVFAGATGKIIIVDYRAEFRMLNNGFIPNYVDKFYDVSKGSQMDKLIAGTNANYMGFLLGAGKNFKKVGGVFLNYEHYFPSGTLADVTNANPVNMLHVEAYLDKCLFKKAYGKISYDRKNFAVGEIFNFTKPGSSITTQIFYQVTEGAYVGMTYKTYYENDSSGNPVAKNTFALETQMGF